MKLLIVDDHVVVLEGAAALLRQAFPAACVFQARDAATAVTLADAHHDLDAVLLDLMMPGQDGMSALESLGQRHPWLPVLVFSSSEDPVDVRRALALGALGYVPKSANASTLVAAVTLVLSGEIYAPPLLARASSGEVADRERLTARQQEVLGLIGAGLANKQIAHRLALSEKTVKAHVTAILRALNVDTREKAASLRARTSLEAADRAPHASERWTR